MLTTTGQREDEVLPRAENRSERSFKTGFLDLTQYLKLFIRSNCVCMCVRAWARACVRERETHT